MLNKILLIGFVGANPEIKNVGDQKVANFDLAISEKWKNKKSGEYESKTTWLKVVAWRHLAELAEKYLYKGSKIYIEGKVENRNYEKDGQKIWITEVIANQIIFLDKKEKTKKYQENDQDDLAF